MRSLSVAPPPTPDGRLRVIDIDGVDRQACGGTHLSNTAQSRPFRITKVENKGKRNRRIRFELVLTRPRTGALRSRVMADAGEPLYYHDYLQLDQLLSCQQPASDRLGRAAHDELLFIIVHQAYELWFKQILHELDAVIDIFAGVVADRDMLRAVGHLQRVAEIERLLLHQVDVLETMTPLDFLDFRDLLVPASGFQSVQFRMIENRLGVDPAEPAAHRRLRVHHPLHRRASAADRDSPSSEPSLFAEVEAWLERTPFLNLADYDFWREYRAAVERSLAADRRAIEEDPRLDPERAVSADWRRSIARPPISPRRSTPRPTPNTIRAIARISPTGRSGAALLINLYRDEPVVQLPFRLLATLMDVDEGLDELALPPRPDGAADDR